MVAGVASSFGVRACATVASIARSLMFEPLGSLRPCVRYACRGAFSFCPLWHLPVVNSQLLGRLSALGGGTSAPLTAGCIPLLAFIARRCVSALRTRVDVSFVAPPL